MFNTKSIPVLLLMMLTASARVSAEPAAAQAPRQAIESFFENVKAVKFPVADTAAYEKTSAAAGAYLDTAALGKKAMGDHWNALSGEEQEAFSDLLEKLIRAIAYPRTQKFLDAQTVTYGEPKTIEEGMEITSAMTSKETGLEIPVVYHLYSRDGQWKIFDVFLDGISMTEDLQYQFDKIMSEGGAAELLKQMQIRLDRADKENAAA